jgi:hypothetical protein
MPANDSAGWSDAGELEPTRALLARAAEVTVGAASGDEDGSWWRPIAECSPTPTPARVGLGDVAQVRSFCAPGISTTASLPVSAADW